LRGSCSWCPSSNTWEEQISYLDRIAEWVPLMPPLDLQGRGAYAKQVADAIRGVLRTPSPSSSPREEEATRSDRAVGGASSREGSPAATPPPSPQDLPGAGKGNEEQPWAASVQAAPTNIRRREPISRLRSPRPIGGRRRLAVGSLPEAANTEKQGSPLRMEIISTAEPQVKGGIDCNTESEEQVNGETVMANSQRQASKATEDPMMKQVTPEKIALRLARFIASAHAATAGQLCARQAF